MREAEKVNMVWGWFSALKQQAVLWALPVVWIWLGAWVGAAQAEQIVTLTQAQATLRVNEQVFTREVTLPYVWDKAHPGASGDAEFELNWPSPLALQALSSTQPWGLFLPYVGSTFEVWFDDQLLLQRGDLSRPNSESYSRMPQWIALPPQARTAQAHRLKIRLHADAMRRSGLGVVQLGPQATLLPVYERAYAMQWGWPLVVMAFSLTVSVWSLLLWRSRRRFSVLNGRDDQLYWIAAMTEVLWSIRMVDNVLVTPPIPWPWWGMVLNVVYVLWMYCAFEFVHRVTDKELGRYRQLIQSLTAAMVTGAVLTMHWRQPAAWTMMMGMVAVLLLVYGTWFCIFTARRANIERVFIAVVVLINVLAGFAEWFTRASGHLYTTSPYLRYTSVLFGWALVLVVVRRFQEASERAHELVDTLSQRVKEKEQEIAAVYAQREQYMQAQVRLTERNRILRDMHDGVGSHVSAAIHQLEGGETAPGQVVQTLKDSLEQLKLSVDMMSFEPGDVTGLLASLRYRMGPRIEASGIALVWDLAADMPLVQGLDLEGLQHVRYMVFEVLSNALQHSKATTIQVSTALDQGAWVLRIQDNGVGFDVQAPGHNGLRYMRERAQAIGAALRLYREAGWTCVEISFGAKAVV